MSDLIPNYDSLSEMSRRFPNARRLSAALSLADTFRDKQELIRLLLMLGLAERHEDGSVHSSRDVDGRRWFTSVVNAQASRTSSELLDAHTSGGDDSARTPGCTDGALGRTSG